MPWGAVCHWSFGPHSLQQHLLCCKLSEQQFLVVRCRCDKQRLNCSQFMTLAVQHGQQSSNAFEHRTPHSICV
jgi:hypothetical protein